MRYCYHCHRMTSGDPLFCGFCARTYDAKLCPRRHRNPVTVEVCSECGSRDLSLPQPRGPWWLNLFLRSLILLAGLVLLIATLFFLIHWIEQLLTAPQPIEVEPLLLALLAGLIWLSYVRMARLVGSAFGRGMRKWGPKSRPRRR